jgi:hypothetical protein
MEIGRRNMEDEERFSPCIFEAANAGVAKMLAAAVADPIASPGFIYPDSITVLR